MLQRLKRNHLTWNQHIQEMKKTKWLVLVKNTGWHQLGSQQQHPQTGLHRQCSPCDGIRSRSMGHVRGRWLLVRCQTTTTTSKLTALREDAKLLSAVCLFVGWLLLNVPATCECISGTDLLRQVYVLPH